MLLNDLYEFFRRKPVNELIEVIPVKKLDWYLKRYPSIYYTFENQDFAIIKRDILLSEKFCKEFEFDNNKLFKRSIKEMPPITSNVAITCAIIAYFRVRNHSLINDSGLSVLYMDTDSMFIDRPISNNFISEELGDLKDELKIMLLKKLTSLSLKFID